MLLNGRQLGRGDVSHRSSVQGYFMRRISGRSRRRSVTSGRPTCGACDAPAVHPTLELTGERTLPGIPAENYWFRRHEAAYDAVVPFCPGAVVLEAGCGEGYGADRIAAVARARARARLRRGRGRARGRGVPAGGGGARQPGRAAGRDGGVDVVASLQVIEHLWDQPGFLAECRRVLRPAGTLLVTTPNRLTFSPPNRPMNPFHHRELDPDELAALLDGGRVRGQPAARAAARAAAAPAGPPVRLAGGRAAGRAAGDLAPGAAPGGRRGPDDRLRARGATTSTACLDLVAVAGPAGIVSERTAARWAPSAWCCTPTCRGWRTPGPGRSARSGCTRRSPAPGGGCSRCWTGWPPRAPGTCSPSA